MLSFFQKKYEELGITLSEVQQQAVLKTTGPLLLLASPGSGKTTTIIMKIGYLIESQGIPASRIKAVTFSKASALDMKERFAKFFPYLQPVDFSTIHSLAFQVVREYFYSKQISYQLIEGELTPENRLLHKKVLLRNIYQSIHDEVITEDQLEELVTYISYIKNKLIPPQQWEKVECSVSKASEILAKYEDFKQHGTHQLLVDYDDMLTLCNSIFETEPAILQAYQNKYDYLLTDESQDTSLVQHTIVEKLVSQHHNLCVVADEDQSIYSWRGAEPQYLIDFKKTYPEAEICMMVQNYRSSQNIVEAANQFIKQNKNRYDKNMFTDNPAKQPIQFKKLIDYNLQAKHLVAKLANVDYLGDCAILYRNNSSSIALIDAFDRNGIPFYSKDSDNRFFKHWIVEDMLNFMRLSFNLSRVDIFEKIYSKMNAFISKKMIQQLHSINNGQTVFDNIIQLNKLDDWRAKKLKELQAKFKKMHIQTPKEIIALIRHDFGYELKLEDMSKRLGFNLGNLKDLLNTLEVIAASTATMIEFANRIKHLEHVLRASKNNKGKNAVTLSTFHSSKGLEFEHVYMIDLINGVIPSEPKNQEIQDKNALKSEELYEEEVRLFYVGMTRAITYLELISYDRKYGEKVDRSDFFNEVKALVEPNTIEKQPTSTIKQLPPASTKTIVPSNPNAVKDPNLLVIGCKVKHRVFGHGEIISCDYETIEIQLPKYTKKLMLETCLDLGLLELVE